MSQLFNDFQKQDVKFDIIKLKQACFNFMISNFTSCFWKSLNNCDIGALLSYRLLY
mgnify:CR=1